MLQSFNNFFSYIYRLLENSENKKKETEYIKMYKIHETARFGYLPHIVLKGPNIEIGEYSYFNSGRISSGAVSKVIIGKWCAIGHNVSIAAITHDTQHATGFENKRPGIEKDIVIKDNVWIGLNVYIREGVTIGEGAVIGANSIVTKDVPSNAIVGGVPAKILKFKNRS